MVSSSSIRRENKIVRITMVLYPPQGIASESSSQGTTTNELNSSNELQDLHGDDTRTISRPRKKSVHFADTKGLALASTFFFAKESFSPPSYRKRIIDILYRNGVNKQADGESATLLNFKSPVSPADFSDGLTRNNVCLEKTHCNQSGIYGKIKVNNLAFEKEVSVRFTFDSWTTFQESNASHVPGSGAEEEERGGGGGGEMDTFFFHLQPPAISESRKMEFAIRYKVVEDQFWDNNFGDNYRLVAHSVL